MKYLTLLLLVSSLAISNSCKTVGQTNDSISNKHMNFKVISSGDYGGISTESQQIVDNEKEYNRLFTELFQNIFPSPAFTYSPNKSYVFITFGQKSSGGLNYKVTKVETISNKIMVTLESLHKNSNIPIMSTQAIADPYIVIEIDKTPSKEVVLVKQ